MKIKYQRFDFAKGTAEECEREIETAKVLAGNALFQKLKAERKQANRDD